MRNNPTYIIVHHTGVIPGELSLPVDYTFELVKQYHISIGWETIGYHYFIDKNGVISQGRADLEHGAHCKAQLMNVKSIGVCLAGDFDSSYPTQSQISSLRAFLLEKMTEYAIPPTSIVPHRHFAQKTCYGKKLSDRWVQDLLN